MRRSRKSGGTHNFHQISSLIRAISEIYAGVNVEVTIDPKEDRLAIIFESDEDMAEFFLKTGLDLDVESVAHPTTSGSRGASPSAIQITCKIMDYDILVSLLYDV